MSRKDTIIIAVLINAGLLMVLFATAISSNDDTIVQKPATDKNQERVMAQSTAPIKMESHDALASSQPPSSSPEIDQLLNQFASIPLQSEGVVEEIVQNPVAVQPPIVKNEVNTALESTSSLPIPGNSSIAIAPIEKNSEPSFVNVTVKKGDYLEKIAKANGSSVNDIMKANKLETTQLKIGQVLKIPTKGSSPKSSVSGQSREMLPSQGEEFYVVKNGDNPWLIASKNQVKLEELLRLNNLDEQKARKLKPGDKIRIR